MENSLAGLGRSKVILLTHFIDKLLEIQSRAGCNDMDTQAFLRMTPEEKCVLEEEYNRWDATAKADDYDGPVRFESIPDFCWLHFLRASIKDREGTL